MSDIMASVITFMWNHPRNTAERATESHHRDISMCVCLQTCKGFKVKWPISKMDRTHTVYHGQLHANTSQTRHCSLIKWLKSSPFIQVLTFQFVVLRVSREKAVGEELGEGEACVLWPVLNIVSHCGLKLLHELWWGCSQLLDHLVPLVDVWCGGSGLREIHSILYASQALLPHTHILCVIRLSSDLLIKGWSNDYRGSHLK